VAASGSERVCSGGKTLMQITGQAARRDATMFELSKGWG
jgi:hypothetical protein